MRSFKGGLRLRWYATLLFWAGSNCPCFAVWTGLIWSSLAWPGLV